MEQVTIQDPTSRRLLYFWYGMIIYCAGSGLADLGAPFTFKIGVIIGLPMALYGLLPCLEWLAPAGTKWQPRSVARYIFFYLLLAWCLFMWLNSERKDLLTPDNYYSSYDVLPYLSIGFLILPAVSLVRSFYTFAYRTYRWYWVLAFLPLIDTWNNGFNQTIVETFIVAAVFIFLTNKYHSSRTLIFAVICLILGFLMSTVTARRNMMLTIAFYMMVGSFSYVFGNKIKSLENRIVIIACACLFMLTALYVFMADSSGAFSLITQRASENTRDGVLLGFVLDMDTMSDWIYGRGLFGTYYCPGIDDVDSEYRSAIECGYLQQILKGGCIYLFLYLVTLITAMVRGFRGHNQLCKASAWILVIQIIDMLPFGLHAFNTKTFMIWMAVAICFSRELCAKNDAEIADTFFTQPSTPLPWQKV
jgi:hypothetical protein